MKRKRQTRRLQRLEALEPRRLLAANLVAHWLAEDLTGEVADGAEVTRWEDSVQQAAALQRDDAPRLIHGARGGRAVVRFDARDGNDLLQVGLEQNPMSRATDFSVTVAFATSGPLTGGDQHWFTNTGLVDGSNLGLTQDWGISLNAAGQASVGMGSGFLSPPTTLYSEVTSLNDGNLHVLSFTRRGSQISLYVDDQPPVQQDEADAADRARNEMVFGGLLSRENYFTGDLAEVRVFDTQLTATEVANLHEQILAYYSNQAPSVSNDRYQTDEDRLLVIAASEGVLANDQDADGDPLTVTLVQSPAHGQLQLQPDGSFTYRPDAHYFGSDSFTYAVGDGRSPEVPGQVQIEIQPVYDPVLPVADQYRANPTAVFEVAAPEGVTNNDVNIDNLPLTVRLARDVERGELRLNVDGSFRYDPQGFSGTERFDYQVHDGTAWSSPQTVTLVVNTRPNPRPDVYETREDTQLQIDALMGLLANDQDDDGNLLTAVINSPPQGTLTLHPDGSFDYRPPPDFTGVDLFGYSVSDGVDLSVDALVQIRVEPVNDVPASRVDKFFTLPDQLLSVDPQKGVLANDMDVDGDTLLAQLVQGAEHGQVALQPDGSFTYRPRDGFAGDDSFVYRAADPFDRSADTVVHIRVEPQPVMISELMASNATTLPTRIRDARNSRFRGEPVYPDWIELFNFLSQPLDLSGMHLTDDPDDPAKWAFPSGTVIMPQDYLVVFASGADVRDLDLDERGSLHTSFQLAADGEYLAITGPRGEVLHAVMPAYPRQRADISFGFAPGEKIDPGYFLQPTPGQANASLHTGLLERPAFSIDHGFFDAPFQLQIASPTPGATIRFTTDGSEPTEETGTLYRGPLRIDRTTTLRAVAFQEGMVPSLSKTQTYFFLDDVLDQSSTPPAGYPRTWGRTFTDWGMDQNPRDLAKIAGDENLGLNEARELIKRSLLSLPTMSLVTSIDGIFGDRNGIYANTQGRGDAWERPVSVEYISPDGAEPGFQINAGIRMQGFTSRDPTRNPKHSLRLVFRNQYGSPELEYPLFGPDAASSFDTLVLRSNAQDAWVYDTTDNRQGQFIRDQWARATQLAMGQPAAHGTWVHLYINGLYWGLYNPTERPDASFAAAYFGGDRENWDVIKNHEEVIDGNDKAYRDLLAAIQVNPRNFGAGYRDLSDNAAYFALQGRRPDGTRDPDLPVLIDVPSLIDYIIHGAYAAAHDWPGNYYMARDRSDASTGFKFFMWDNEHGMKPSVQENRTVPHSRDHDSPTKFYHALRANAEFRLLFADHLHRTFFNGGPLYVDPERPDWDPQHPERNVPAARWMQITQHIEEALIAEAARWGDVRGIQYTPHDQFQSLRDRLLRSWFPNRSRIVFQQFKRLGLYPDHEAPVFHQHGGRIGAGFELQIINPNDGGTVFYTMDGSDPRVAGIPYDEPLALTGKVTVKARTLLNGQWSALNAASFSDLVPADETNLRISEINYHPAAVSDAERAAGITDDDEFEFIELVNISNETIDLSQVRLTPVVVDGDEEGVHFAFADSAVTQLAPGQAVVVVENIDAFVLRYGSDRPVAGQWSGKLNNRQETLTVSVGDRLVQQFTYADQWHPATDGHGSTLELINPFSLDRSAWNRSSAWRPSRQLHGSPGTVEPTRIPGDANRDGVFDSADLVAVFQAGEYEDAIPGNSTFATGDWNGDGDFTTADLVFAFQLGLYAPFDRDAKGEMKRHL